ncbi:L-threonylcarbamoyladenylate synthase [Candidatus Planktophila limnetica]|uniref:Threonylcarbamoyl-AMP synthase n=1 Tax=Candidatus Planktophila limnetica TaxID=573600 RepID=A0A249LE02_9ACTN|nr:L-threonylcarbamoyladenylate synthase [Candidatus Planktophila limnetica]ASY27174.1 L-threonylcarbamoyladenylate synthase [Candidatus Planktophila limnetica]
MSQGENAQALKNGALIAFPTETVYGLGADASNEKAVARIYEVKGRPQDHPLILHIASMNDITYWATDVSDYAMALARSFWPGPMTLIFKRSDAAKDFVTGGQDTVGLRVPDHALALELLQECKKIGVHAIAAPSANKFGHVSPTTAAAVQEEIGTYLSAEDLILDGGAAQVGLESTIIDCTGDAPKILRPGAITQEMIEKATGMQVSGDIDANIRVSGSLEKHYAPNAQILLDVQASAGQGFIAPAEVATPSGAIRLVSPANTDEFARTLYSALRDGDAQGLKTIAVIQPSGDGLAIAIRDRLMRASKGR